MQKILISKCLLGEKVNYLGNDSYCSHLLLKKWENEGRLLSVCPEVAGGATIPRPPAAIIGKGSGEAVLKGHAIVMTNQDKDVTDIFLRGAETALNLVKKFKIKVAILKARSPSCGSGQIYDGSFTNNKIIGDGVTAALLKANGVRIFNEEQISEVEEYLMLTDPEYDKDKQ